MIKTTFCLLLATLLTIIYSDAFAQQNLSTRKPDPEIEALKSRISELESKLQTVENVEKIELMAKLAEANAKLANAEIDKYKRELRDVNDEWLKSWSLWFLTIIGIFIAILIGVSAAFWFWLRSRADQLIADSVEKSLSGFKEIVDQVNILQDQIRILEKEHAASVLEAFRWYRFSDEHPCPEEINVLSEIALLDVFSDKMYYLHLRYRAAEVLTSRGSTRLTMPILEFLNTSVDSDLYDDVGLQTESQLRSLVSLLSVIHTQETYEGLKKFLKRLLTESPKHKGLFLTWTVFSLAYVGIELNRRDSVSIIRKTIPNLKIFSQDEQALKNLAEYFDRFNEPEGIKEILTHCAADRMPEVEPRCLELLEKHDPDFVKEWQVRKTAANTENEESE